MKKGVGFGGGGGGKRREMLEGKGKKGEVAVRKEGVEEGKEGGRGEEGEKEGFLLVSGKEVGEVVEGDKEVMEGKEREGERGGGGRGGEAGEEMMEEEGKVGMERAVEEEGGKGFFEKDMKRNKCYEVGLGKKR